MRSVVALVTAVTAIAVVIAGLVIGAPILRQALDDGHVPFATDTCRAFSDDDNVRLTPEQMRHAATISAVGLGLDVPERAVVVALATAMQESELRNLAGGDRDSIGLFQQRPSQGWGTPAEIGDPRYAARRFYDRLLQVPGWEDMRVTDAAQEVQRSALPEAYEQWAADATVLADAFVGGQPGAVTCQLRQERPADPAADTSAGLVERLAADLRADWGEVPVDVDPADGGSTVLVGDATAEATGGDERATGWRYAHWLVAWSAEHRVDRVTWAGRSWTADGGTWEAADGGLGRLTAQLAPPGSA